MNQYENGKYWAANNSFHEEDSDFKFDNFQTLLKRNPQLTIDGIIDLGCGAGRVIWNFSKNFENSKCVGIDLDAAIVSYAAKKYMAANLSYRTDFESVRTDKQYNLIVLADVFEHIEDYIGFLKDIQQNFSYHLFNIPLDLSLRTLIRNGPVKSRDSFGHLHYFYDRLALQILEENGFSVIDFLYADNIAFEYRKARGARIGLFLKLIFSRGINALFGKSKTSILLGCYSLTVLCSSTETK